MLIGKSKEITQMAGMSMNQIIAAQGSRRASRPRPLPSRAENPFQPRTTPRATAPLAVKRTSNPGTTKRENPVVVGARTGWGGGWYGGGWGMPGMWGWGYPYGRYALPVATVAAPVTYRAARPHPSVVLAAAAPYAYPYSGWGGYGWGWGGGGWPYARASYGVTAVS